MRAGPLDRWEGHAVQGLREAWGVGGLEVHASLGSTSDRGFELAASGAGPFTVVIADEQTAGRGRRGARWHSASGAGLWMSLVLPPSAFATHLPLRVGLAVAEGVEEAAPGVRVGLEWPNDLVTPRGKLGGILCESAAGSVVAGVGVNVRTPEEGFPASLARPVTALEMEMGKSCDRKVLASMIVSRIKARLADAAPELPAEVLAALSQRDVLLDRDVATEEKGPGTARGIDSHGALVLERPDGTRVRVVAGSVRPL